MNPVVRVEQLHVREIRPVTVEECSKLLAATSGIRVLVPQRRRVPLLHLLAHKTLHERGETERVGAQPVLVDLKPEVVGAIQQNAPAAARAKSGERVNVYVTAQRQAQEVDRRLPLVCLPPHHMAEVRLHGGDRGRVARRWSCNHHRSRSRSTSGQRVARSSSRGRSGSCRGVISALARCSHSLSGRKCNTYKYDCLVQVLEESKKNNK